MQGIQDPVPEKWLKLQSVYFDEREPSDQSPDDCHGENENEGDQLELHYLVFQDGVDTETQREEGVQVVTPPESDGEEAGAPDEAEMLGDILESTPSPEPVRRHSLRPNKGVPGKQLSYLSGVSLPKEPASWNAAHSRSKQVENSC